MKNLLTVFIIFHFAIYEANSQSLSIVYEACIIQTPEILEKIPELSEYNRKSYYSLNIYKSFSKFSRDSTFIISFPDIDFKEVWEFDDIYKDYNKDSWIRHSGRHKEGYGLEKKISQITESNNFQWKISQDKQVIAGIECNKAVSPKGYTAWFAPQLPYPDGPQYGVFNLPGLVLSLETPNSKWIAKDIIIHNKIVEVPKLTLVQNERQINLSYDEMRSLGAEKAIIIDKNTPKGKWITFKE